MRVGILGGLDLVGEDGANLTPGAAKERGVVSFMALRAGRPSSVSELVDALWGESPPPTAVKSLQSHIARLRQRLGADAISGARQGYRLNVRAEDVDAVVFERLVRDGRALLRDGKPGEASAVLDDALKLWRGEPLMDLPESELARAEAVRLAELAEGAKEDRVEARLALGDHEATIAELERMVNEAPLRERRWSQLMLALYRSGRQADALRAFGRLRSRLGEELGIEPSGELVALEEAVLLQKPELNWVPSHRGRPYPATGPAVPVTPTDSQSRLPATRENVAALFTDVVGWTDISSQLTPAEGDSLRQGHFSLLRRSIAESDGTEVKNLGDGLMVVFPTASAALSCAVGMQQGVDLHNRSDDIPIGLRIGLSFGEVTRDEDDYFGDPVVEAARLCTLADGSQILATATTRAVAGRRSPHSFHGLGPLELKGLPEPVETVAVGWERVKRESSVTVPLPARLGTPPVVGVVGRAVESSQLVQAYDRAAAGRGREVVLVCGEPGVGKTTLVSDAARTLVEERDAWVLLGRCAEDVSRPYHPFAEALGHLVTHAPEDLLLAHAADHGSGLASLVPALRRRLPDLPASNVGDTETERYLLFAAVAGVLSMASRARPVIVILEDLAWADKASLQLLRHVVASTEDARITIIGTYRDTEVTHAHPFVETIGALRQATPLTRIELTGLDNAEVVSFMEAAAGHVLDADSMRLAGSLHRETDGNPFFVGEVLRHLSETGAVYQDDTGHWTSRAGLEYMALPASVREVVRARVVRLGSAAEQSLAVAAVIGQDFDVDLLCEASGRSEDKVLDVLDAAAGVALVQELATGVGRYSFRHALIQHTLYEDIGRTRRAKGHRRVGEALERIPRQGRSRLGELAYHWCRASESSALEKGLEYSRRAAEEAIASLAPDEAVRHYTQALELVDRSERPDQRQRLELMTGLGDAQRQAGDPAFRRTLLDAAALAEELGATEQLVRAALLNNRGWTSEMGHVDAERVAVLEAAIARLPDDGPLTSLLMATLAVELAHTLEHDRCIDLGRRSLEMARRVGDAATLLRVLNLHNYAIACPETLDERLDLTQEAVQLAGDLDDSVGCFWAQLRRTGACAEAGMTVECGELISRNEDLADNLNQPVLRWVAAQQRCWWEAMAGRLDQADEAATRSLELGTDSGQPEAIAMFAAGRNEADFYRGTLRSNIGIQVIESLGSDELRKVVGQDALGADPSPTSQIEGAFRSPVFRAGAALAFCRLGRPEDAKLLLHAASKDRFRAIPHNVTWLTALALYAEVSARLGEASVAGQLYRLLAPWESQLVFNGTTNHGVTARFLALAASILDRPHVADRHFQTAIEIEGRVGAPAWRAETLLDWGRAMLARPASDRSRIDAVLTEARALADAHACSALRDQATEVLNELHGRR